MIDIKEDHKGEGFILTQTTNIEGDNYHKQLTLSPYDLDRLYSLLRHHWLWLTPHIGEPLEQCFSHLLMVKDIRNGLKQYANFMGKTINSDMTLDEVYQKVHGCTKAEFDKKVEEERRKYAHRH